MRFQTICGEHKSCAWCGQSLCGWDCVSDEHGTYWCDDNCADEMDEALGHAGYAPPEQD